VSKLAGDGCGDGCGIVIGCVSWAKTETDERMKIASRNIFDIKTSLNIV
jgi:hypothetical protein